MKFINIKNKNYRIVLVFSVLTTLIVFFISLSLPKKYEAFVIFEPGNMVFLDNYGNSIVEKPAMSVTRIKTDILSGFYTKKIVESLKLKEGEYPQFVVTILSNANSIKISTSSRDKKLSIEVLSELIKSIEDVMIEGNKGETEKLITELNVQEKYLIQIDKQLVAIKKYNMLNINNENHFNDKCNQRSDVFCAFYENEIVYHGILVNEKKYEYEQKKISVNKKIKLIRSAIDNNRWMKIKMEPQINDDNLKPNIIRITLLTLMLSLLVSTVILQLAKKNVRYRDEK